MKHPIIIQLFYQDLRLGDNSALHHALELSAEQGASLLPIYILDDENAGDYKIGGASRLWLHHSLQKLSASLYDVMGGGLSFYRGDTCDILSELADRFSVQAICYNQSYEPYRRTLQTRITQKMQARNIQIHSHDDALLWQAWQVKKPDNTHYKVFTPFYQRGCMAAQPPAKPLGKFAPDTAIKTMRDSQSLALADLALLPSRAWGADIVKIWQIGEVGAGQAWQDFTANGIGYYDKGRDFPAKKHVSRLSPYLHFGEISIRKLWHEAKRMQGAMQGKNPQFDACINKFCSELAWREFSHHMLYHYPDLPHKNLQAKFDKFPWKHDAKLLRAWQKGETGVPIVDAGMRQLWQTGYIHNRVRMIVGSFLVKNLRLDWRLGASWFWDCLVDADLANNSASWQWIAGCGADAAPYFRIFNPVTQAQKFDADGEYIHQFVPELRALQGNDLFAPWQLKPEKLQAAGITLGVDYPHPIVDLVASRNHALEAFKGLTR
ncbi:MAG: DNA photolyase family protein [Alphaproteobacteria bacterium]|nr:DNA photolyase family protein [Alphaproteobacteria bacterium]